MNSADFLNFCHKNLEQSFSQNFQDLWALWVTGGKRDGYFVEFGALNGKSFSNSYMLEKIGWDGIVAEPHPSYAKLVPEVRNCHFSTLCVYDVTDATVIFQMVKQRPAMSGISNTQLQDKNIEARNNYSEAEIKTITLNDLLAKYNAPEKIDYISIDTEGSEVKILRAFDFNKHDVGAFCIEHNFEQRAELLSIMTDNGYKRLFTDVSAHDDWYVKESTPIPTPPSDMQISDFFDEVFDIGLPARKAGLAKLMG